MEILTPRSTFKGFGDKLGGFAWAVSIAICLFLILVDCSACQSTVTGVPSQLKSIISILGLAYSVLGLIVWVKKQVELGHLLLLGGSLALGGLIAARFSVS